MYVLRHCYRSYKHKWLRKRNLQRGHCVIDGEENFHSSAAALFRHDDRGPISSNVSEVSTVYLGGNTIASYIHRINN